MNKLIATFALLLLAVTCSLAQDANDIYEEGYNKYRVVAYKNGDAEVKSYSNTITIARPFNLYAPTAFSPDDDGVNDLFFIRGGGISEFYLEVFNRWGELIFVSNDPDIGWDGTYEGVESPMGGYVYQVTGRSMDGTESVQLQGTLALVR